MRTKKLFVMLTVVGSCMAINATSKITAIGGNEDAAEKSAQQWLAVVDSGKYEKSWEIAAPTFKKATTKQGWAKMLQAFRGPLGKVVSRKLKSATSTTSLPGAPDGQYVVIQYDTSFEKKAEAVETITPAMGDDKVWKVSGYQIK